jgi:hypothetical protein
MSEHDIRTLDAYLDSLRAMPNAVGDAVRAIDAAEGLPPLAQYALVPDALRCARSGENEESWVRRKVLDHLGDADAYYAAFAAMRQRGLWPW